MKGGGWGGDVRLRVRTVFETEDDVSANAPGLVDSENRVSRRGSPFYLAAGEVFHD